MRFEQTLIEGTLLRRQRQFSADVRLVSGEEIVAHCANPGSLEGCAEPGNRVLVSVQDNPRSKFSHHVEIIYVGRTPVAVHTGRPAMVVAEAITKARIPQLAGYAQLRREGRNTNRSCRIDLVVEGNGLRPCYMKLEYATLARDGQAYYPDAPVDGGVEAMSDLTNLVREGNRAMVMLIAPRNDVNGIKLADDIDPEFTQALRDASARGVEVVGYRARVTKRGIELDQPLPVDLTEP